MKLRARLIAYYLPQYHVIPENKAWWGEQFTDWLNVKRARPLFEGHYQPRVPLNQNYYDLRNPETIYWQTELARTYGLSGFCHYHYWFDGRQLLEAPTNFVIANKDIDFPFCLAWINASWARRWNGDSSGNPTLLRQTYSPNRGSWMTHFEYLFNAWSDARHVTVDGKPVFLIYNPHTIPRAAEMLELWREEAVARGLRGLHLVAMQRFEFLNRSVLAHYDATVDLQPGAAMFIPRRGDAMSSAVVRERFLRGLPDSVHEILRRIRFRFDSKLRFHDYESLWRRALLDQPGTIPVYPGGFVDWDNSPRYGHGARIVRGASPEAFGQWLGEMVNSLADRPLDSRLVFLNAWNEWAEGAYLEPDERYGFAYLEALRDAVFPRETSDVT
jgi:lipopolysaccharide biosynthesis protein